MIALAAALALRLLSSEAAAAEFAYVDRLLGPELASLASASLDSDPCDDANLYVEDDLYLDMAGVAALDSSVAGHVTRTETLSNQRVENVLRLRHHSSEARTTWVSGQPWSLRVSYAICGWDITAPSTSPTQLTSGSLTIDWDPDEPFVDQAIAALPPELARHRVQVDITGVELSGAGRTLGDLSDAFVLEAELGVERYFHLDLDAVPTIDVETGADPDSVELVWDFVPGAEAYELEVVHQYDTTDSPDWSNATRVRLEQTHTRWSLAYDEGRLWFRVRGMGRGGEDFASWIPGSWSDAAEDHLDVSTFAADWSWQVGAVYAEHGRRVETVSFFDGTQRKRQTAVRSAAQDRSLLSQTAYDFEGRPVVSTLPAPNDDGHLGYEEEFHRCSAEIGGTTEVLALGPRCFDHADTMLDPAPLTSGLGADWYGGDTPHPDHDATSWNSRVPDAGGYPYTRLLYGPDGRPRLQGGVGAAHRVGGERETRMLYPSVSQAHLDRWFGAEAGFAQYYTAEATRDPNQQWSLAYKNLRGQVVATALIGPAPDGLDPVYTDADLKTLTEDLMTYARVEDADRSRVVQVEHLVSSPGTATLAWSLAALSVDLGDPCAYEARPCRYDLSLRVLDADGQLLSLKELDPVTQAPTGATSTSVALVGLSVVQTLAWSVDFPEIGTYTIEKRLTLSPSGLEDELDAYESWLRQDPATTDPAAPTDTCMPDFETLYNQNTSTCGCGSTDPDCVLSSEPCEGLHQALVDDLTPGGAYWDESWLETWAWPSCTVDSCTLTKSDCEACKFWQNAGYLDSDGDLIVSWEDLEKHWTSSQGAWPDQLFDVAVTSTGGSSWKPDLSASGGTDPAVPLDWGAAGPYATLLQVHPEFCHYAWCTRLADSDAWDAEILGTVTQAELLTALGLGALGDLMSADPYFGLVAEPKQVSAMKAAMASYQGSTSMLAFAQSQSADPDEIWAVFRALYLSQKRLLIEEQKHEAGCGYLYDAPTTDGVADGVDPKAPTYAALQGKKAKGHDILVKDLIGQVNTTLSGLSGGTGGTSGGDDAQNWTPNCLCLDLAYALNVAGQSAADLAAQLGVAAEDVGSWQTACAASKDSTANPQGQSPYTYDPTTGTWDQTSHPVPEAQRCWLYEDPCAGDCDDLLAWSVYQATERHIAALLEEYQTRTTTTCLGSGVDERFTLTYPDLTYQIALYYYDQAGNRVATVPPAGVTPLDDSGAALAASWRADYRTASEAVPDPAALPAHTMVSDYTYNAQNQPLTQRFPDYDVVASLDTGKAAHSAITFLHDSVGRLRFSQNARQRAASKANARVYAYLRYDAQGRVVESGQVTLAKADDPASHLDDLDFPSAKGTAQVTRTVYDEALSGASAAWFPEQEQQNLRGRVAAVTWRVGPYSQSQPDEYDHGVHYSYDVSGNVADLAQQNLGVGPAAHRVKTLHYRYDRLSGSVTGLDYQAGQEDAFSQRYTYDADNRLTSLWSSADCYTWDRDGAWHYFPTGELARQELGDRGVQGLDHVNTVQGWIRAVNGPYVAPDGQAVAGVDPGEDGLEGVSEDWAPDAFGYTLRYFAGDYAPVSGALAPEGSFLDATLSAAADLYNGNIQAMTAAMGLPDGTVMEPFATVYTHDQLNRLKQSRPFAGYARATGSWSGAQEAGFGESLTYDGNGNILTLARTGAGGAGFDGLAYTYTAGSNRLAKVADSLGDASGVEDIGAGTFNYDAIGSLSADSFAQIGQIGWLINGKPSGISRKKGGLPFLGFRYDGLGERVGKVGLSKTGVEKSWYVRDARGEVIAVYSETTTGGATTMTLDEVSLMGGSRIGVWAPGLELSAGSGGVLEEVDLPDMDATGTVAAAAEVWEHQARLRRYELTDHLGNVRVAISDVKRGIGGGDVVDGYAAEVLNTADYYPFGMMMPGRTSGEAYRYGFNGKEQDAEVAGTGNWYDYGFRVHNPRLGRFVSVDPLANSFPYYTPFSYAGNQVAWAMDLEGAEQKVSTTTTTTTTQKVTTAQDTSLWDDFVEGVVAVDQWFVSGFGGSLDFMSAADTWLAQHRGAKGVEKTTFGLSVESTSNDGMKYKVKGEVVSTTSSDGGESNQAKIKYEQTLSTNTGSLEVKGKAYVKIDLAGGDEAMEDVGLDAKLQLSFGGEGPYMIWNSTTHEVEFGVQLKLWTPTSLDEKPKKEGKTVDTKSSLETKIVEKDILKSDAFEIEGHDN